MARTAFFQTPLPQRDRLEYLREFLTWLYEEGADPIRSALGFWRWYTGAPEESTRDYGKWQIDTLISQTKEWDWGDFRRQLLERIDTAYDAVGRDDAEAFPAASYRLRAWKSKDGHTYFTLNQVLPTGLGYTAFMPVVLEDVLRHLEGLATDALARCARLKCLHLFLRLRARQRRYCSTRCRNLAVKEGLTTRRAKKSASHGRKRKAKS